MVPLEWFNSVDATYRSDLRELNELNFARFDAKVEQRWAQLDAKLEHRLTQLDAKFEQRLTQFDAKFEQRLTQLDAKLEQRVSELRAEIQVRVAEAKNELDGRINALRVEMQTAFARVDQRFAELETRLTKRLFGFWVAQAATTAGLVFGVVKLLGR